MLIGSISFNNFSKIYNKKQNNVRAKNNIKNDRLKKNGSLNPQKD